ncbi:MAG: alpha/beta hydrolase [Acetobacteraceae bacterium]|nr:alpha/beta hydrolase [Acetobacteraceae bacterium]
MAVHPVIQAMLDKARAADMPPLSGGSPEDARRLMALLQPVLGAGVEVGSRETIDVPTRGGSIRASLLRPRERATGLIVYLHGGGWVIGSFADYAVLARKLCAETGCAVLVPEYRLAPEHPFPAGPDDCEDALLWAYRERRELIGHDGAVVLAGDSAGGNLATVTAAALHGRVPVAGQVLIYPVTDCDFDRPSYEAYGNGDVPLSRADMLWFFQHYAPRSAWDDPRITPLHALSLREQPPTLLITAENDVLRDEGEAYAARLAEAGVQTTLRRYDGMTHGFIRYHDLVDVAGQALRETAADIVRFCHADVRTAA